ncbi:MAG: DNA-binding beta-propeller fold protein YncE [Patiriisocius sp.]|jgi:DNA-binding beta-propeller fold protein YncE
MTKLIKLSFSLLFVACIFTTTAQTITGTEAVEYDPIGNRFLITNGNSILSQNSGSSALAFFGSGDADYGMEVIGNILYTISGSGTQFVKSFDLTTEEELNSISIPGSGFLNGMASDPTTNRIWITDFSNGDVIEIDVSTVSEWVTTTIVTSAGCTPNGITHDNTNNRLVYTCWDGGNLRSVDLDDNSTATLVNTGLSQIDGIDHDNNGNFYISSWSPTRITKLTNDFATDEIITAPGLSNPADISYAIEIDTLAIANSGNNTITYIGFDTGVGVEEISTSNNLSVYPNPVSDRSFISFSLESPERCTIALFDQSGKKVHDLINEKLSAGDHKVLLTGLSLSPGLYLCEVNIKGSIQVLKLVVE